MTFPGIYIAKEGMVTQELELDVNGEYINSIYENGCLQWIEKHSWTYEESMGGVVFSNFRFALNDTPSFSGYWFVEPERSITGAIRLCYDPDLRRCFQSK